MLDRFPRILNVWTRSTSEANKHCARVWLIKYTLANSDCENMNCICSTHAHVHARIHDIQEQEHMFSAYRQCWEITAKSCLNQMTPARLANLQTANKSTLFMEIWRLAEYWFTPITLHSFTFELVSRCLVGQIQPPDIGSDRAHPITAKQLNNMTERCNRLTLFTWANLSFIDLANVFGRIPFEIWLNQFASIDHSLWCGSK